VAGIDWKTAKRIDKKYKKKRFLILKRGKKLDEEKKCEANIRDKMNTVQRIAKNTGVLLISQIASYIIGFFFVMYTARYLGAEGFGINPFCLQKHLQNF